MVKIGCSSLFFWEYDIGEIVDIFLEIGLKNIEFFPENPEFWKKRNDLDYINNVKSELSKLDVTIHAPYIELNSSSTNENIRLVTLMETFWAIDLSKKFNAKLLTIHPGKRPTARIPTDEEYNNFEDYLEKSINYALKNEIILCLENSPEKINNICYNVESMKKTFDKFENLYMTLDIAHARENSLDFIKNFHKKIKNIHISGVNSKDHYPLSESKINFDKTLNLLVNEYRYTGALNFELNDLIYKKTLLKQEKTDILINEIQYLEKIIE
ncbi:sugar phosphate isomerase/epimerase [Methanococcus maripaludis]|uniref:Sugar phosphate isomerase/epimerase n=1 Tax=Methanococcus maripaludis TaxID=39152 RepID=A0A7J9NJY7_METMI|nr:sugar phosphate isomerase/epimerase [Methanococcus maripaludis]MBA2841143.1 sugar phosphate isomerase/epimerase [Methanococcus maripaludis]